MTLLPREQIAALLRTVDAPGSFAVRRTPTPEDLHLEVKGLGPLHLPVSRAQAQQLCRLGQPARYGRKEQTLLDRDVRDTWEIPLSRVKIDQRRWNKTLRPLLAVLRSDLGLPAGSRLKAALHSLLVYAPGQFFLPHQDSEKDDAMIGTLVVTLPSSYTGGDFVVEHHGEKVTFHASKTLLSCVAFYADCQHEVRPVKEGYRIVLTYNLMLDGAGAPTSRAEPATVEALALRLREHFETPLPPRQYAPKDAPPLPPPDRLVYLLDHQYTERGLAWQRLKGEDAVRAAALRAAAERADCEMLLALADVHEIWSCLEEGWNDSWYDRRRRWSRDEDEDEDDDEGATPRGKDRYELLDLQDWEITLQHWTDLAGKKAEPIVSGVADSEVCFNTPSSDLEPYASEYEGFMGNYGNTMDRWYRRGALVLWPREHTFAVRAEASPVWALKELAKRLRGSQLDEAREMAAELLPFWRGIVRHEDQAGIFDQSLRVAAGLEDPELATALLRPFHAEALTRQQVPAFVGVVGVYGDEWTRQLFSEWSRSESVGRQRRDRVTWFESLPRLCQDLRAADDAAGTLAARRLLQDRWAWWAQQVADGRGVKRPSYRSYALEWLVQPLLGLLTGAVVVPAEALQEEAVTFLCAAENEPFLPYLVQGLQLAVKKKSPVRSMPGFETLRQHCVRLLEAELARPARAEGDWSLVLPPGCRCELCAELSTFLADPRAQQLAWPLAEKKRQHVHQRIDEVELPVHHETRRTGSPYTLLLTKTQQVFAGEAQERQIQQTRLDWLRGL